MREVQGSVGDYLAGLTRLLVRASPGPLAVSRTSGSRYAVTGGSAQRPVATMGREADARLFARALPDLRVLATAVAEVLGRHHDDGAGRCVEDGQPVPCTTRRVLEDELCPRTTSS